jgi:tRNA 5-methylaminomethyl-2-thiouridine biosynthesis bifunctional protein
VPRATRPSAYPPAEPRQCARTAQGRWPVAGLGRRTPAGQRAAAGAGRCRRGTQLPGLRRLPLKRIRGQITRLPATEASRALQTVVCAEGYAWRRPWR